jgi:tetraacyldisaccharide 4'-kinase
MVRVALYSIGIFPSQKLKVPVIFVGNIRVGGTGKTPCVIALAKELKGLGFHPGIISRGYYSSLSRSDTLEVVASHLASEVGDEPLLIKQQLQAFNIPVWIGANRFAAGMHVLDHYPQCNVIISDDGLQHLQLARQPARNAGHDIEIIIRDHRGEGNGQLLPAGPLRESNNRLRDLTLNLSISTSDVESTAHSDHMYAIHCTMNDAYQLVNPSEKRALKSFAHLPVLAVAGIADPEKFYSPLKQVGMDLTPLSLGDHADYTHIRFDDYLNDSIQVILMTEKDAVKCKHLNDSRIWVVPLEAHLPKACLEWISRVLHRQP